MNCPGGIVKYLITKGHALNAYSSSVYGSHYPENAFVEGYWVHTGSSFGEWWSVSFPKKVMVYSYTISSPLGQLQTLYNWEMQISDDNFTWETVDVRNETDTQENTKYFPFNVIKPASHIKLNGYKTESGYYFVKFNHIEFFGTVVDDSISHFCRFNYHIVLFVFNFLVIVFHSVMFSS